MLKTLSLETKFKLYLAVLSIAGLVFILITTSKYGAGVSSDAVRNLSTAENLLAGKGFVDLTGTPFILWPPLYPLVMAGISLITRWTVFQSAWYLNILLYAANLWLMGWYLFQVFKDRWIFAAAGALFILLSRSILRIYANVASEPLFMTFMLLFFFGAARYLRDSSIKALWFMFIMAGLATLQRYLGVVLFGVGFLLVFVHERYRGILRSLLPAIISAMPTGIWMIFHNYRVSGTFFGPRDLGTMLPLENMSLTLTKILWWFIPRIGPLDAVLMHPWIVLAVLALALVVLSKRNDWRQWFGSITGEWIWPGLVFSVLYFLTVSFTVVTADHLDLTSDRYYVIILPFVLVLVLVTLDRLILNHFNPGNRLLRLGIGILLAAWFVFPIYSIQEYLGQALVRGEPTNYNIANSAQYREMTVVKAAQKFLSSDPSATIYTNYVNILWFIYQRPVAELPLEDPSLPREQRLVELQKYYPNWPGQAGYIIWFTPNQYHFVAPPDELMSLTGMKLLFEDKTGQIYYVPAKTP